MALLQRLIYQGQDFVYENGWCVECISRQILRDTCVYQIQYFVRKMCKPVGVFQLKFHAREAQKENHITPTAGVLVIPNVTLQAPKRFW